MGAIANSNNMLTSYSLRRLSSSSETDTENDEFVLGPIYFSFLFDICEHFLCGCGLYVRFRCACVGRVVYGLGACTCVVRVYFARGVARTSCLSTSYLG